MTIRFDRNTPESLRPEAERWHTIAEEARKMAVATASHRHLQSNAERAARRSLESPTSSNLNLAASLATLVADSAESLAQVYNRSHEISILPPATVITCLGPDGWIAEALVHDGDGVGMPILRSEGWATEAEALSGLRKLALHPDIIEAATRIDYHGTRIRAAAKAAEDC